MPAGRTILTGTRATASDQALIGAFRKQLRAVLDSGDGLAFLGLWVAWKDQADVDRDDLVDVLKEEGVKPPGATPR